MQGHGIKGPGKGKHGGTTEKKSIEKGPPVRSVIKKEATPEALIKIPTPKSCLREQKKRRRKEKTNREIICS